MSKTSWGTLEEVRDWSRDLRRGTKWVGRSSGRFGTGRGTLGEVRDGLGPSWRSGTGQGTLGKFRDGSGDPQEVQVELVNSRGGSGRVL